MSRGGPCQQLLPFAALQLLPAGCRDRGHDATDRSIVRTCCASQARLRLQQLAPVLLQASAT